MKYIPLIWAGLWRKRARTTFTLLSALFAFILFGFLQGTTAAFDQVVKQQRLDVLKTSSRYGVMIPIAGMRQIEKVRGVTNVAPRAAFSGYYQDPKNFIPGLATDPTQFFSVRQNLKIPPDQLHALAETRTGAVVGIATARKFSWKIGDRISLHSKIIKKDGSADWAFDIVGIDDDADNPGQFIGIAINYDYLDKSRARDNGTVSEFISHIDDPRDATVIAHEIDGLFANSSYETETMSDKESMQSTFKQIGDIKFVTDAIVGAVFFTLLFMTANTMAQSVRERIPEIAVLKTLGFSNLAVLTVVMAESLFLCGIAAFFGLLIASVGFPALIQLNGPHPLSVSVILIGASAALLMGLASGAIPALRAMRLQIVDALAA